MDLSKHFFKSNEVEFDDDNFDLMKVSDYRFPSRWKHIADTSPLLISFPTEYPQLTPVGFYLNADLPYSPNGHLYDQAYHDADTMPMSKGWKWYCVYVLPGVWQPVRYRREGDWKKGDSLWTYMSLVDDALQSTD